MTMGAQIEELNLIQIREIIPFDWSKSAPFLESHLCPHVGVFTRTPFCLSCLAYSTLLHGWMKHVDAWPYFPGLKIF
ncbi:hypothetical protein DAPPUDRAFT_248310 [Daphnia pulex]|uniref:Uncharacterized protein n=1 Tax=Daphnia pulex TaxID=6669 RepID=E9GU53_DAPPU|nr:hypothetical protein DAPPUDRAFT_248310 [Daphnia pulex]|eukprot:EFX77034.1 hypothetical protein DAPPUDRAFT_248310 [Daphnia pulex]